MSSIFQISERQLAWSSQLNPSSSKEPEAQAQETATASSGRAGFFSLLDAAVEAEIPYTMIENPGITVPDHGKDGTTGIRYGYSTGVGYSGRVIRHSTETDTGDVKEGTLVALKQFLPAGPVFGQGENEASKSVFQAARREVKALCHPLLRYHENICRIKYIGWHDKNIYPMIALELARYGTLEDVMIAPGMGLSWLQKMNLTIDMISGLQVIHSCGMIHGDIKPGNFIVQQHETRQIVAKMIDFAGSRDIHDDPDVTFTPGMGTKLWQPPEVSIGNAAIDWYKADSYSLGLVIASLWARPPVWAQAKLRSSCLLERYLPLKLNEVERQNRLIIMKTHTDINIQSVMQLCWCDQAHINPVMLMTLSVHDNSRMDGVQLAALILPGLCHRVSRELTDLSPSKSNAPNMTKHSAPFTVFDKTYIESSPKLQKLVYEQLLKAFQLAIPVVDRLRAESLHLLRLDPSMNKDIVHQVYASFKQARESAARHGGQKAYDYGIFAHELSVSHFLGLGTPRDLAAAVEKLYAAALTGCWTDFQLLVIASTPNQESATEQLRSLILILGSISGFKVAKKSLRLEFPEIYQAVSRSLMLRPDALRLQGYLDLGLRLEKIVSSATITDFRSLSLRTCFETHNAKRVREILERDGFDDSISEQGLSGFHYLTYLEDEDAASMAALCHQSGASLSCSAPYGSWTCPKMTETPPSQTPLAWAWAYGMEKYFDELLQLHIQHGIPISDYYILLFYCSYYHTSRSLQSLLKLATSAPLLVEVDWNLPYLELRSIRHPRDTPDGESQDDRQRKPGNHGEHSTKEMLKSHLQVCVSACHKEYSPWSNDLQLLARMEHGSLLMAEGRIRTLQVLIDAGADVISSIAMCFADDDVASCSMLCELWTESPSVEIDSAILSRLLHASIHGHPLNRDWPLYEGGSPGCFEVLISYFPQAATTSGLQGPCFSSPLCTAASMRNPLFARRLLEVGTDLESELENNPPLALALANGHVDTAKIIYKQMTEEQRRQTFEGHPVSGFTMMGRLMWAWVRRRDPAVMEALAWLKTVGGVNFWTNTQTEESAWSLILGKRPSPVQSQMEKDNEMLRMLFGIFPEHINDPYKDGFAPIHWAACQGNVGVLKTLVSLGVDINSEVPDVVGGRLPGRTALDIALWTQQDLEKHLTVGVSEGGASERQRWRQRCVDTLEYLRSKNAKSGSGSTELEQMEVAHDFILSQFPGQFRFNSTGHAYLEAEETAAEDEVWPEIPGSDETSPSPDEMNETKRWMKVHCVTTNELVHVSRYLAHRYLHPDHDQPGAGQIDRVPAAYSMWLNKTARARKTLWINTRQPSDDAEDPPFLEMTPNEFKQWHCHGWRHHKSDRTLERLPRYRLIFFIGRPLGYKEERDFADLLKALEANRLASDDMDGPNTVIISQHTLGTYDEEQFVAQIKAMKRRTGNGLRLLLCFDQGRFELTEDQKKLFEYAGWDKARREESSQAGT